MRAGFAKLSLFPAFGLAGLITPRFHRCVVLFAGAMAAAMVSGSARAAETDTQLWITGTATTTVADDVSATANVIQRFREQGDQRQLRGQADWRVASWLTVGGGLTYSDSAGPDEWRPHQQVSLIAGPLQVRTQLEERYFDGNARPQLRLRERAQLGVPISKVDRLSLSAELLYIVRPETEAANARVDQWRFLGLYQRDLAPGIQGGIGYMLIHAPREGAPNRLSHAPQVTLAYRF